MAGFAFRADANQFRLAVKEIEQTIANAATATIREAGETVIKEGRANIAAAGFSERWQDSLQVRYSKPGINASALIFDTIPYFGVFEEGGPITGSPLLWLPLPTVPLGIGGRPLSPREAASRFGQLVSINRVGHKPLLAAKVGGRFARAVPLFVGVDRVDIRKRFAIRKIIDDTIDSLPNLFDKNLKDG